MPLPAGLNGPNGLAIDPRDPARLYLAAWGRSDYAQTTIPGCTNPFWVAINTFLSAVGVLGLDAEAQEEYFDVPSAVAAAAIAVDTADDRAAAGERLEFVVPLRAQEQLARTLEQADR